MGFRFNTRRSLGLPVGGGGSAILKPQDVFQILAQPANAMQAAINALPFSPDILIGKDRMAAGDWSWRDSLTGLNNTLASNTTAAQAAWPGYSGTNNRIEYAFKQQAGVIWRVTWTGDGTSNRQIPHGLGVVPGMIAVKSRSGTTGWPVYHRSLNDPANDYLQLQSTNAVSTISTLFGGLATSTTFTVGGSAATNNSGTTYVALVIAHDPSADGIVQCGSFTGNAAVTLGWRPQYLLFKRIDGAETWFVIDTSRAWGSSNDFFLQPNTADAEATASEFGTPTATGFQMTNVNGTYVYLAIRAPY